jgi:hypothetical protein
MADITDSTINDLVAAIQGLTQKTSPASGPDGRSYEERAADLEAELELQKAKTKEYDSQSKNLAQQAKLEESIAKQRLQLERDYLKELQSRQTASAEEVEDAKARLSLAREQLLLRIDENKEIEKTIKGLSEIEREADILYQQFTGITNRIEGAAKGIKEAGGPLSYLKKLAGEIGDRAQSAGKNIGGWGIGLSLASQMLEKVVKSLTKARDLTVGPVRNAMDFDAALEKAVKRLDDFRMAGRNLQLLEPGEIDAFRKSSIELSNSFRGTSEDVKRLNVELFQSSRAFRELKAANDPAADSLLKTSFLLERRLNVPISQTAKVTELASQAFGKSAAEAEGFASSMGVLADRLGLDVRQVFSDFQAQSNNLAKFGLKDLQGEFLKLSKIQQTTGISIDSMISSMETFSTFEGALTAASKLNAVFGTTIDGLELMDKFNLEGPVEAFISLRENLEQQGLQIDELNYSQMRALTQSVGLSAEQMRKFGEVSSSELRNITAGAMDAAEAEKLLSEAQGEGETTAEMQAKAQDRLMNTLDGAAQAMDRAARSLLKMAEAAPRAGSALQKFGGIAIQAVGALAGGLMGGPMGAMVGMGLAGGVSSALGFAPGDNFISQPTIARVGEVANETINRSSQMGAPSPQALSSATGITTILNPGDKVERIPTTGGGSSTSLTINLVGADGAVIDTSKQTITSGDIEKVITHYLNSKVSLLNA